MSTHTPGPWVAQWDGERWQIIAPHTCVAEVYNANEPDKDRDEGDACLIAAAPELLAALLALADRVAVVIESDADDGKPEDAELRTAWDAAGVAIAKAEGRS